MQTSFETWATPERVSNYVVEFASIDSRSDLDAFVEWIFMAGWEACIDKDPIRPETQEFLDRVKKLFPDDFADVKD